MNVSPFLFFTCLCLPSAMADVLEVPSEYPTIQAAIAAATDGDTIAIAAGNYSAVGLHVNGLAITLEGETAMDGSPAVILDGQQSGTVLMCQSGEDNTTVLRNLMVINGSASNGGGVMIASGSSPRFENCAFMNNTAIQGGGAIYIDRSSPIFSNCVIRDNAAERGGGVYCIDNANPEFLNCRFESNQGGVDGGGLYNILSCTPVLTDCEFISNQVSGGQFAFGGGIYNRNESQPQLTNCLFRDNQATAVFSSGGAIANTDSSPVLIDCVLDSNSTGGAGGGMSNTGAGCEPVLSGCEIAGNTATNGGGLSFYSDATAEVVDCVISANTATNGGGVLNFSGIDPVVSGTLVCGNDPNQIDGTWVDSGGNEIANDCPSECPDVSGDGFVGVDDLLAVVAAWGTDNAAADVDGDGLVGTDDLLAVIGQWGPCV